jgi:hypothetical protein
MRSGVELRQIQLRKEDGVGKSRMNETRKI